MEENRKSVVMLCGVVVEIVEEFIIRVNYNVFRVRDKEERWWRVLEEMLRLLRRDFI